MMNAWLTSLNGGFFLLAVLLLLFFALGVGEVVLRQLFGKGITKYSFFIKLVVGLNLLYLMLLAFGMRGWMRSWWLYGLLAVGSLAFLLVGGRDLLTEKIKFIRENRAFTVVFSLLMLFFLAPALCFPLGWDAHTYHLALPVRWARDAMPLVYSDLPYSGFPSAVEFVYWALFSMGGIRGPGLLVWLVFCLLGIRLYLLLKSRTDVMTALTGSLVFVAAPVSMMLLKDTYIEPFLALNLLAGLELADDGHDEKAPGWKNALLWGLLIGGCGAMKLNGVLIGAVLLLLSPWCSRKLSRHSAINLGGAGVTAAVFMLPFYLRPWLATGNPFFPFFADWFSVNPALLQCGEFHHLAAIGKYGVEGVAGFLTAPLLLAWQGRIFDSCFGWPLLMVMILALLHLVGEIRNGSGWKSLRVFMLAVLIYVGWFLTAQQARFLLPWFLLILLIGGDAVMRFKPMVRTVILVLMLLSLLPNMPIPTLHSWNCWRFLAGNQISVKDFIFTGTGPGYLAAAEMVGLKTPENARVLLLFDHRSLLIPRHTELGTPFFQPRYFTPPPENAVALLAQLQNSGITHLLIGMSANNPDRQAIYWSRSLIVLDQLSELNASKKLALLWQGNGYSLYSVNP